jgi:CBS domain-containing protein
LHPSLHWSRIMDSTTPDSVDGAELTHARDVMTTSIISVGPDVPVREIATLLLDKRISAVPVVNNDGVPHRHSKRRRPGRTWRTRAAHPERLGGWQSSAGDRRWTISSRLACRHQTERQAQRFSGNNAIVRSLLHALPVGCSSASGWRADVRFGLQNHRAGKIWAEDGERAANLAGSSGSDVGPIDCGPQRDGCRH